MNNKIFVALKTKNAALIDGIRVTVEGEVFFNRYGSSELFGKYGRFGMESLVVDDGACFFETVLTMLRCSHVYFPCGWNSDKEMRKVFAIAEVFGKRMIFEEDWRCR